jgi:hypothetical protein
VAFVLVLLIFPVIGNCQYNGKDINVVQQNTNGKTFSGNNDSLRMYQTWTDSIRAILAFPDMEPTNLNSLQLDSLAQKNLKDIFHIDSSRLLKLLKIPVRQNLPVVHRPVIQFNGGSISYNWNFRSAIDTPFKENSISQHLLTSRLDFTLSQTVPISMSYFERQTNSYYFRDYRDVRVEFNTQQFQKLKVAKLEQYLDDLSGQLRNPVIKPALDASIQQFDKLGDWLNQGYVVGMLIKSRVAIINGGFIDTASHTIDTSIQRAKDFIAFYDLMKSKQQRILFIKDSLQKEYVVQEKRIGSLKKILESNLTDQDKKELVNQLLNQKGITDSRLNKIYGMLSSIQAFGIGKLIPSYSDLTLKNININGINFEYYRKIYFAISAGAIDYRARDFFNSQQKTKPQFVYITRFGFGSRQNSHFYLTAFKGKKQLMSGRENAHSLDIYGLSFESQLVIDKVHRLLVEVAQSASPNLVNSDNVNEKPSFNFRDEKNKAWAVKLNSYLPKTASKFEAYYKYRGINFQSFSSYYSNAAVYSWQVKVDQYFWKRQLKLNISIAKNNYDNSYLPVRYSGRTSFKTVSFSFTRKHWPSLQVGFVPSSQLSVISGQIYENVYQSLNLSSSHSYKLGMAHASSFLTFNRFYNSSSDSGFIYFNAKNFFFGQLFQFPSYAANLNITRSQSNDYILISLDAGTRAKIGKQNSLGFGVKINQLNNQSVKLGFYGNHRLVIQNIGEINVCLEKNYLPGWNRQLIKTELYNIGFTKFLK